MSFFKKLLNVVSLGLIQLDKPKLPAIPEMPLAPDIQGAEAKKAGLEAKRKQQQRSSTFLTSGGALGDTNQSSVAVKTLLGQ
jgi:hypothetical protein